MANRVLSSPKIFQAPLDEEPTVLISWQDVKNWAERQSEGWRDLAARFDNSNFSADRDDAQDRYLTFTEWDNIAEMAGEMVGEKPPRRVGIVEPEAKLEADIYQVVHGIFTPATSVFGQYILRVSETNVDRALELWGTTVKEAGVDAHEIRWGPYRDVPVTLRIPGYGRTLKFSGWGEVAEWAAAERQVWDALCSLIDFQPQFDQTAFNDHINHFKAITANAKQLDLDSENLEAAKQVSQLLKQVEEEIFLVLSGSRGQKLRQLFGTEPSAALSAIMLRKGSTVTFHPKGRSTDLAPMFRGQFSRSLSESRIKDYFDGADAELTSFADDWQEREAAAIDRAEQIETDIQSKFEQFQRLSSEIVRKGNKAFRESSSELKRLRDTYEQLLKLQGPAKYWRDKRFAHLGAACLAFVGFALVGGLVGWLLWENRLEILTLANAEMAGQSSEEQQPATALQRQIGSLIVITIPTVFVFWLLRLISRIFVTNLAGMTDAGHRATLISTYLALMNEDTAKVSDEERLLLIQGIINPPGSVGDDAAPSSMLESLARTVTSGSRSQP